VKKSTAEKVKKLAEDNGVTYEETPIDKLAVKFSELSGDDVRNDDTLNLIVALKRAEVISSQEVARLTMNHLHELQVAKLNLSGGNTSCQSN